MKSIKEKMAEYENQMRESAYGICNVFDKMIELDKVGARDALYGIIQYLSEKVGDGYFKQVEKNYMVIARLKNNAEDYKSGIITKEQYEENKKQITAKL